MLLAFACNGEPTSPIMIDGRWNYLAEWDGCTWTLTLDLEQGGGGFVGGYAGPMRCDSPIGEAEFFFSGRVSNGALDGASVTFDIDGGQFRHRGLVSGSTMSGVVVISGEGDDVLGGPTEGSWQATR